MLALAWVPALGFPIFTTNTSYITENHALACECKTNYPRLLTVDLLVPTTMKNAAKRDI